MRYVSLTVFALALLLPARVHAQTVPHWTSCAVTSTSKSCVRYAMPRHAGQTVYGHWRSCSPSATALPRTCVTYPVFSAPVQLPGAGGSTPGTHYQGAPSGFQQTWWITYYTDYGYMADGAYVHAGAAACGYEEPFYTRVYIPGVGLVTCEDRPAVQFGYHHADVWEPSTAAALAAGLGSDYRVVTIYG